jgi:filamentous hemagglutinin family protein
MTMTLQRQHAKPEPTAGQARLRLSANGRIRLAVLMAMGIPLTGGLVARPAEAAAFGSAAWFAQAQGANAAQPATVSGAAATPGGLAASIAASRVVVPTAALTKASAAIGDLTTAIARIKAAENAQTAAHAAAAAAIDNLNIPDGLASGGLAAHTTNPADCAVNYTCNWQNAQAPTSGSSGGKTTVTVTQTAQKAILTWDSFNISKNTTLSFDQSAGTQASGSNNWVVLNRVLAGSGSPAQIMGGLKAQGSVYIIDPNGIIFGGASQVSVHSLLASSLPLFLSGSGNSTLKPTSDSYLSYSNEKFLDTGISGLLSGNILGLGSGEFLASNGSQPILPGNIEIEAGADIETGSLGYALLAAPNIVNAGSISATDGQVLVAGGLGIHINSNSAGSSTFAPVITGAAYDSTNNNADVTPLSLVDNTGIIAADRGTISLLAGTVQQDGVVKATTSVSRPGGIIIGASESYTYGTRTGSLELGNASLTAILPDTDAELTTSSPSATTTFQTGSIALKGGAVTLKGMEGIDPLTGKTPTSAALIEAPGQSVSITAIAENDTSVANGQIVADLSDGAVAGRVYMAHGATIDVAGLADVELPMSANLVTIPRLGLNELADSPLQRDGVLFGASVVIDERLGGTRADGLPWVGTPLADLQGYVQAVPQNISELLQNGGNISLAGNDVIARTSSSLNLSGGYLHYLGGSVQTTQLLAADGTLVNIADADPMVKYLGIAGQYVDGHPRWNASSVYSNPVLSVAGSGGAYESDYIKGGNAGTLSVIGLSSTHLDGSINAQALAGRHQVASGAVPDGGTLNMGGSPLGLFPGETIPGASPSYEVKADATPLDSGFSFNTVLPPVGAVQGWTTVSSAMVAKAGFSQVNIRADAASGETQGGEVKVDQGVTLSVQAGTTTNASTGAVKVADGISITGARVTVDGALVAPGGSISMQGTGHTYVPGSTVYPDSTAIPVSGDVTIGSTAMLDASGQWVNDSGLGQDQISGGGFINGGSISISTLQNSFTPPDSTTGYNYDLTGAIDVQGGSLLNVSSGGRLLQSGALATGSNSVPLGQGGSISVQTYVPQGNLEFGPNGGPRLPGLTSARTQTPLSSGSLTLDGTLLGYGFGGGGTLSLRALAIQIGGNAPAPTADCNCSWTLALPDTFFDKTGFGSISLLSEYNATIVPNTTLHLSQYNLLPDLVALRNAGTNANILGTIAGGGSSSYVSVGQLDTYHRAPVNFSMYGGDYANWLTNRFAVPSYAAADGITGAFLLGADTRIIGDAGASITLGSNTQVTIDGSIYAPGGSITLTGDTGKGGYAQVPGLVNNGSAGAGVGKSVWLDSAAVLDVSGEVLVNPLASEPIGGTAATSGSSSSSLQAAGKVLAGGTVTVTDDTGYVIMTDCMDTGTCPPRDTTVLKDSKGVVITDAAGNPVYKAAVANLPAATIRANGATGTLMEPTADGSRQATTVVSNAGTIKIGAGKGTYLHANIEAYAAGNAPNSLVKSTAEGGTLYITPEKRVLNPADGFKGATGLTIGPLLPESTEPLAFGPGDPVKLKLPPGNSDGTAFVAGNLYFSPDLINGSGITTLHLGSDPTLNPGAASVPITFTYAGVYKGTTVADEATTKEAETARNDIINLNLGAALYLNASSYQASTFLGPAAKAVPEPINVNLSAPYINISGLEAAANYPNGGTDPNPGISKSSFSALAIRGMDLGGQFVFDNFSSVSLSSTGDIRLVTPSAYGNYINPSTNVSTPVPGLLQTSGALNLSAAQIYPATDNKFVFISSDAQDLSGDVAKTVTAGSITINHIGDTTVEDPLSAGGVLIFDAPSIAQNGVVRAPDGQIYLGISNLSTDTQGVLFHGSVANPVYDSQAEDLLTYNVAGPQSSTQQIALPVVQTNLVTLGATSVTSVAGSATVPYGSTVDGQNLIYNPSASGGSTVTTSNLLTAPNKLVSVESGKVVVRDGATVDISGGGDLQAQEWVAGTGGTRNVLAATNTSYVTGTAAQVPLYADGRAIYAIVPGYTDTLGAYDPALSTTPMVGQSVYLSGVPGLPAGTYTLLPARYATLPGAYRVVQDTAAPAYQPVDNQVLADGSARVGGYYVDALTGAKADPTAFLVQSGPVWQQYSQYQLTSLNQYFSSASAVRAGAYQPMDAGQFNLNLNNESGLLSLPTLLTAAPAGATGAELDLGAPDIQVADIGIDQLPGSLLLHPEDLDKLGLSRIVLGGISQRQIVSNPASGNNPQGSDVITSVAREVDINTPRTPLAAPEILAVSQTDLSVSQNYDDNFNTIYTILADKPTQGVYVEHGSIIQATSTYNAARDLPILIGLQPISDINGNLADVINGDGSLLRVSSGAAVTVTRANVPGLDVVTGTQPFLITTNKAGGPVGSLTIGDGAQISASGSILVDATGNASIAPTVQLATPVFAADSSAISFKADSTPGAQPSGLVLSGTLLSQLTGIDRLILDSRTTMSFFGNVSINSADSLELSAGTFVSDGGSTTVKANSLMLANDLGAPSLTPASGNGHFTVNVGELDLGNNSITDLGNGLSVFSGFTSLDLNASSAIVARGTSGGINAGSAALNMNTPLLVAATGSNITLGTLGAVQVQGNGGNAMALSSVDNVCLLVNAPSNCQVPVASLPVGGAISLNGGSVKVDIPVVAPAGRVSLDAGTGDLTLGSNASINVAGVSRSLFDTVQVASGGSISLTAQQGAINALKNTTGGLDFAGVGGGSGGRLSISAPGQGVNLAATLNYTAAGNTINGAALTAGQGGSFALDSGSLINLDTLSQQLAAGGVSGDISVHSRSGGLALDQGFALTGSNVSLIADGSSGNLDVAGRIDVSGSTAGNIDLFGSKNVLLTGTLLANSTGAGNNGGGIRIGTTGSSSGTFNTSYGYEQVSAANSGSIKVDAAAVINVAGGQGGSGGIIALRAPLLSGAGADGTVNITAAKNPLNNSGARDVSVEAYATWSAADSVGDANKQFDGIIDPAGLFDATGIANVDVNGTAVTNTSHVNFYTGTLKNFVQQPGFSYGTSFDGINNLNTRAGIDLINPSASVNAGNISVLSDWNLGAGSVANDGSLKLDYRTANTVAPVLSLRAKGNIQVGASLSDGFFQRENPFDLVNPDTNLNNGAAPVGTASNPLPLISASLVREDSTSYRLVAGADFSGSDPLLLAANTSTGDIILSGHESSVSNPDIDNGLVFVAPTMVRTGVGSISVVAAGNIAMTDTAAPGVIYTAGTPAVGTTQGAAANAVIVTEDIMPPLIDTGAVNPVLGGNVSLYAGNNITGITEVSDTDGSRTGIIPQPATADAAAIPATDLTQYWWPWMQNTCVISGCSDAATSTSINFGMFDQGIMSVGGNVRVTAGNNIANLSVSLPTTWAIDNTGAEQTYGGGNLNLSAGGNLTGGSVLVGRGTATMTVGGAVASDLYLGSGTSSAAPVLAMQDARLSLQAGGYLDIGGVFDPSYLFPDFDRQSYSTSSSVSLTSLTGNLVLGDATVVPGSSYGSNNGSGGLGGKSYAYVLPATVNLDALGGGITLAKNGELFPSATGNLSMLATGDINLFNVSYFQNSPTSNTYLGLIDAPLDLLPSATNPDAAGALNSFLNQNAVPVELGLARYALHTATPLHAGDSQPLQIYSRDGDIIDGQPGQNYAGALILAVDKRAEIHAGRDLVNLSFYGQNLYDSDVSLLQAGRDFYDPSLATNLSVPVISLGGPGALDVLAGRDLGPITSVNEAAADRYLNAAPPQYPGIYTVGNLRNAYLDEAGADVNIAFGVGGGFNSDGIGPKGSAVGNGFAATYINPDTQINAGIGLASYNTQLLQDVLQYEIDVVSRSGYNSSLSLYHTVVQSGTTPTVAAALKALQTLSAADRKTWLTEAYADFRTVLPSLNQQALEMNVLYGILNQVGLDETKPSSPYFQKYGRGYEAINTLFPPVLGYTANGLGSGANGAQSVSQTGTFDMRGSTVQTQRGGNVNIMGPGGNVLVGSQSAPPETAASGITPNTQGILTLENGDVNILTDGSVLLAQSRIFTEQGGDMMIWSSNGDINAGKGAKTSSEVPPPVYICDPDHYCEVDARSQVSGAGIGVLQTKPDTPSGSANLIAPHGTVDAGDAGIRVSGNLNVAAAHVANADNFSVGGKSAGVPTGVTDTASLSAGLSAGNSATQSSDPCNGGGGEQSANCPGKKGHESAASVLEVEVMGYGGGE